MTATHDQIEELRDVSTARIMTVLLERGSRDIWLRSARPLDPHAPRIAGPAFTRRLLPRRADLAAPEALTSGSIVVDAQWRTAANGSGNILHAHKESRLPVRSGAGAL